MTRGKRAVPQRPRRPWRPLDGYWWGGYAAAMLAVIELANEMAERSDRAAPVLAAVLDLAAGVAELQGTDTVPGDWGERP